MLQQAAGHFARRWASTNAFGSKLPGVVGDKHDWEAAWVTGTTPWDAGNGSQALKELVKSGVLPKGSALVPGAGSAYDAVTLAAAGWQVTALDISPTAVKAATAAAKATPDGAHALSTGALRIQCGDFFQLRAAAPFDVVFDYTFLCALPPALRQQWAGAMRYLVAPHGMLATQLFPLGEFKGGPPFALNVPEVTALLQDANFECVSCNAIPAELSHKSREGRESMALWMHDRSRYPTISQRRAGSNT